jgi:hypothetical protein
MVMASPLLETKLHVPQRRRGSTARPRLTERLSRGRGPALALVSAPPGFGKTTLLTEWLAAAPAAGRSVAWLSLDQRDNDPVLFWTGDADQSQGGHQHLQGAADGPLGRVDRGDVEVRMVELHADEDGSGATAATPADRMSVAGVMVMSRPLRVGPGGLEGRSKTGERSGVLESHDG